MEKMVDFLNFRFELFKYQKFSLIEESVRT